MPSENQVSLIPSSHIPHLHLTLGNLLLHAEIRLPATYESTLRWMSSETSDNSVLLSKTEEINARVRVTPISWTIRCAISSFIIFIPIPSSKPPRLKEFSITRQALGPKLRYVMFGKQTNKVSIPNSATSTCSVLPTKSKVSLFTVLQWRNMLNKKPRERHSTLSWRHCILAQFFNLSSSVFSRDRLKLDREGASRTTNLGLMHLRSKSTRQGAHIIKESGAFETDHWQVVRCKRLILGSFSPPTPIRLSCVKLGKQALILLKSSSSSLTNSRVKYVSVGIKHKPSTDNHAFLTTNFTRLRPAENTSHMSVRDQEDKK